ncbi:MAG: GntR family transcriptional regulator [Parvularculaceae bacterium]|nr:GntR family transcriptional regulator [Parvularculaceae bacterium]
MSESAIVPASGPAQTGSRTEEVSTVREKDAIQCVFDGIVYGIRSGQMVPGQHLVEADLTRRFGVSRGSLREGLKRLAATGIVTLTRYRGAFISALDRKGVADLLDVLEPLCTLAATLAAEKKPDGSKVAELQKIAQALSREGDGHGRATYLEMRRRFYDLLIEIGGNTELKNVIPLARTDLFRAQFDTVQTKEQRRLHASGYSKIAEAVAEGDPAKASRAVKKHFVSTRKTLVELPEHAFSASHGSRS